MKRMIQWVMAATLLCGSTVFTACSNSEDNPSPEPSKKDRKVFIEHTRANLKDLAMNMNFGSWEVANNINTNFNKHVLNNPNFTKSIAFAFMTQAALSITPVEEGSELAQMGYKMYGTVDFTDFNYRFTVNEDGTGFDAEEADDFEMIVPSYDHEKQQVVPASMKLTLKASGSSFLVNMKAFGTDEFAVIGKMPTEFAFTIAGYRNGNWTNLFTGTFRNDVRMEGTSQYLMRLTDAFNISGTVTSFLPSIADKGLTGDATTLTFAIGQDPATHEAGMQLGFIHNGRNIIQMRGVFENLNGLTDYSEFDTSMSMAEAFTAVMAGNNLKEGTITLLDDLTTTLKVSDCQKVVQLQTAMASARRNYADFQTIDDYTQQLNQLISGTMACAHTSQQIPMKLQTIKFGVDNWCVPALKFADESGYIALTDILDKESMEYMINIADHAIEPMQQSLIVVRQLRQYIQTLMGEINNRKNVE